MTFKLHLPEPDHAPHPEAVDPLDGRYYDPAVSRYLSERSRLAYQAHVESVLAVTLAEFKICSPTAAKEIAAASERITLENVRHEEEITHHDIKALINCLKQEVSDQAKPFVHFGATSNDIVATASALQLREAMHQLVLPRLQQLHTTLLALAERYASTVQVGRTHGQHAVPITFGFFIAEYVSRLGESIEALRARTDELRGKFSGAVGAYNALSVFIDDPQEFEKQLLAKLDMQPAPYTKQIVPAENIVRLIDELVIATNIMANLSHDMRHLQRTEIAEVREHFHSGQTGSSTMAHKRNPWNFEHVISLAKQVTAQLINANLNIVSEHQRDLTDSASGRYYGITLALVAAMSSRLKGVMSRIEVDETSMRRNLKLSGGAIAAEPLYLLLEKYGHTSAHEVARQLSHQALEEQQSLYEVVTASDEIGNYVAKFTTAEKQLLAEPETYYSGLAEKRTREICSIWRAKQA